jgi:hypothetical protein
MGAALTYARRYALFTLIGIAGEDDLDAPDLLSSVAHEAKTDSSSGNKKDRLNGGQGQSVQWASAAYRPSRPTLEPEASAALRDRLISELSTISSSEEAANWAHRVLREKNSLTAADAERVETAFHDRLTIILNEPARGSAVHESDPPARRPGRKKQRRSTVDKRCSPCQRRVGFAIGITSNQWPSNRVWFVDAVPRMLIICALPNPRHSAARSVMSSRFPSVADTIARCIGAVMKPRGGRRLASIRPPRLASFG